MLSNTAKHFTCYLVLIVASLICLGYAHSVQLHNASLTQEVVDKKLAIDRILKNSQQASKDRAYEKATIELAVEEIKTNQNLIRQLVDSSKPNPSSCTSRKAK